MAGIGIVETIIPVIADTVGLAFSGPAEPIVQLSNFLRTKEILLVVDNMEHLLEGGSALSEILQKTPHVTDAGYFARAFTLAMGMALRSTGLACP
jgi:hypothetical protein